jgi:hypothetical protein
MRTILASLVVFLGFQQGAVAQPEQPAGASAYLMGVFDTREGLTTLVQIVNPTIVTLRILIGFFNEDEELLDCVPQELTENDLSGIDAQQVVPGRVGSEGPVVAHGRQTPTDRCGRQSAAEPRRPAGGRDGAASDPDGVNRPPSL